MPEKVASTPALRPAAALPSLQGLAAAIDAELPQTQCTRCGYPDCRGYAQAVAAGEAGIDRCPPGGAEGVRRLATLTGQPTRPLDAGCGTEAPRMVAFIDEAWCIGCTLCIKACPVDCIAGATKRMHTVIENECTGCELCVPACPVDCIVLEPITAATGWAAWSPAQAEQARRRYAAHRARLAQAEEDTRERLIAKAETKLADLPAHSRHQDPETLDRKRSVIEAALARARAQRASRV